MQSNYDAVIVGSGPNGLAAGIVLAQAGLSVKLFEARTEPGGGTRSAELTLPGFIHDTCSAVHPLAPLSPFLSKLPLEQYGLSWIFPPAPLAHPLDDGAAVTLEKDISEMKTALGPDGERYAKLFESWLPYVIELFSGVLGPLRLFPPHPFILARFGIKAVQPAKFLLKRIFKQEGGRALLAGIAGHSTLPLEAPVSSAVALILALAGHAMGWPVPKGGSQRISIALAGYFKALGGETALGTPVTGMSLLPRAKLYLFDLSPKPLLEICGDLFSKMASKEAQPFPVRPGGLQNGLRAFQARALGKQRLRSSRYSSYWGYA